MASNRSIANASNRNEALLWAVHQPTAAQALDFVLGFLGCRSGPKNEDLLDEAAKGRLIAILRAVSIVESRHGTVGRNQPARDPIQCGNPRDLWWREFTGQLGRGSRFIRLPGLGNLWANEIGDAAEAAASFPAAAKRELLENLKTGHRNAAFAPAHSYVWGTLYLIHRINTVAGDRSYQCGDLSRDRLIDGAVAYNGGGVKDYEARIVRALAEFGDPLALPFSPAPSSQVEKLVEAIGAIDRSGRTVERLQISYLDSGTIASLDLVLNSPNLMLASTAGLSDELQLGQKAPNASEVSVCGAISKKIKRKDPEFATLVSNGNADIVFKDEEGTGADRLMSQRLADGLDQLAVLVAAEWPDVKLRVTEAWDENNEHHGSSLHYEGRAADLTTSPRDGGKLGRLARLAVDAGLDWVLFEDSAHVHVSVKK